MLSRRSLHKTLKKQRSDYKMNKDLEEQMDVDNTIKRANQITTAVKGFEKSENDKESETKAEEDAFYKEDEDNARLEK